MAKHNITTAAKIAGVSRQTIHRHIKKGIISFEIDKNGKKCIDQAEIERYMDVTEKPPKSDPVEDTSHNVLHVKCDYLMRENERLKEQLKKVEGNAEWFKNQLEEQLKVRLIGPKKGFLDRLLGR